MNYSNLTKTTTWSGDTLYRYRYDYDSDEMSVPLTNTDVLDGKNILSFTVSYRLINNGNPSATLQYTSDSSITIPIESSYDPNEDLILNIIPSDFYYGATTMTTGFSFIFSQNYSLANSIIDEVAAYNVYSRNLNKIVLYPILLSISVTYEL